MKKTTKELEGILLNAHSANAEQIFTENNYSFVNKTFSDYFKDLLSQNKISQQKVFIDADISDNTVINSYPVKSTPIREILSLGYAMQAN